jgi:filamentous hemagglutinin family protein
MTYFPGGFGLGLIGVLELGGAITLMGCLTVAFSANPAVAQITPDATLGTESSVVTPDVNIKGLPADQINGGAVRGANLFHSFQEFNVGDEQRVYFANPTGIETILSRITGNNLSNILGTLGVDGGANLFLLNPNGIIFGANAQLDISGSFVASTANSVVFDNGYQFSVTNPEAPPLLTINVPLGVQYGANQPRTTIANTGTLAVGQNFTLNAGNLDLQGLVQAGKDLTLEAQDTVKIRDSAINPFIAAAGGKLLVQGNGTVDIFALNHANSGFFSGGDMVLRSPNSVMGDAHYTTGGNFRIEQLDGSLGNLSSPGDPVIRASGNVSFTDYTGASLHIFAGGSVNITGRVTITGVDATNFINETVTLSDTTTTVTVNGSTRPTLDIRAGTLAVGTLVNTCVGCPLGQPTNLTFPNTPLTADITIGRIDIAQPNGLVFLTNQYQPNTALAGNIQVRGIIADDGGIFRRFMGNSSDVVIDSRGNITIPSDGFINTFSSTGKAGNITLIANDSFSMTDGARIDASTGGRENAGDINIKVGNAVSLTGGNTWILSMVQPGGVANSGTINIQAGSLSLRNGGAIFNTIRGQGDGKDTNINVRDAVIIDGAGRNSNSGIYTFTSFEGVGNSGNINIEAGDLSITNGGGIGSFIASSVDDFFVGQGNAGDININVRNAVTIDGVRREPVYPGDFALNEDGTYIGSGSGSGDAGNINLRAGTLSITDGGYIGAGTSGQGDAGNINIAVRDMFNLAGVNSDKGFSSGLFANAGRDATGQAGNITVSAETFRIVDGAVVNATTTNVGNGTATGARGNIEINTRNLSLQNAGKIDTSTVARSSAGSIAINSLESVTVGNDSVISALSFGSGTGGNLLIDTGTLTISDGGVVVTSTVGQGTAGNLTVKARNSVNVINNGFLSTGTVGTGAGGNISIETSNLNIQNSGKVFSSSFDGRAFDFSSLDPNIYPPSAVAFVRNIINNAFQGNSTQGNSGNLTVKATDSVNLSDDGAIATLGTGRASGGNLSIETRQMVIRDGAEITTRSDGLGTAGNIDVKVSANLLSSGGAISATSTQAGGGDITIAADDIRLSNSSLISTSVKESTGGGGNIRINSTVFLAIEDSDILANAEAGPGGDIFIKSEAFLADIFSRGLAEPVGRNPGDFARFRGNDRVDISADSRLGSAGSRIYPDIEQIRAVAELPSDLVDASEQIDRRCTPAGSAKKSSFTITGRGGLPPNPNDPLTNQDVWVDWINLEEQEGNGNGAATDANPTSSKPQQLVEAQGWIINDKGQVVLIAQAPTVTPSRPRLALPPCEDNKTTR